LIILSIEMFIDKDIIVLLVIAFCEIVTNVAINKVGVLKEK